MNTRKQEGKIATHGRGGFSLIEIMVVVGLLGVIVFGLYSMFDQTQRALRSNTTQVDVLEAGRAALDVITRDVEQAAVTGFGNLLPPNPLPHMFAKLAYPRPLLQTNLDQTVRTNVLQDFFFTSRPNAQWKATGYFIASTTNTPIGAFIWPNWVNQLGVGTLYRFTATTPTNQSAFRLYTNNLSVLATEFENAKSQLVQTNVNQTSNAPPQIARNQFCPMTVAPLIDGVVHFRIRPYDASGMLVTNGINFASNTTLVTIPPSALAYTERTFYFSSNSMPMYLDLELGILEPQVYDKLKGIPNPVAQRNFLARQVGAIHLFRKLILLRNSQSPAQTLP